MASASSYRKSIQESLLYVVLQAGGGLVGLSFAGNMQGLSGSELTASSQLTSVGDEALRLDFSYIKRIIHDTWQLMPSLHLLWAQLGQTTPLP